MLHQLHAGCFLPGNALIVSSNGDSHVLKLPLREQKRNRAWREMREDSAPKPNAGLHVFKEAKYKLQCTTIPFIGTPKPHTIWVAVKELKLSYYIEETLLFTIYTHYGNLI